MESSQERALNQSAFRRLKDTLAQKYAHGHFVAISNGQIAASAPGFEELRSLLADLGKNPTQTLIVQVGLDYPESAVIFTLR